MIGSLSGLKYATSCDRPLSHYVNIAAPYLTKNGAVESNTEENKQSLSSQVRLLNISNYICIV